MEIAGKTRHIGFLLMPNFSLIAFSSAIEPLRMANWIAGTELYASSLISQDGKAVISSAGVSTEVDFSLEQLPRLDILFVCGASPVARTGNETIIAWLRKEKHTGFAIGGIGTGSYVLACAGLLNNHRATIHWWDMDRLREDFPHIQVTNNLFEIDHSRFTCSGGTAAMDMLLFLIGQQQGMDLASAISEQFVCERIRTSDDQQRVPLRTRIGANQPKLIEAVQLIEANIEEPLSTTDLAHHVGVSRRQLERLFRQHLQTMPSRYYLQVRLEKARQILHRTDKPILQVGIDCGFASASYFSTAYRNHYGITPREERKRMAEDHQEPKTGTARPLQHSRLITPEAGH